MENIIALIIIGVIIFSAIAYVVNAKKKGVKCIGCSTSKNHQCGGSCCSGKEDSENK